MCSETPFTVEKISPRAGIELGPLDQWASAQPIELPGLPAEADYIWCKGNYLGLSSEIQIHWITCCVQIHFL